MPSLAELNHPQSVSVVRVRREVWGFGGNLGGYTTPEGSPLVRPILGPLWLLRKTTPLGAERGTNLENDIANVRGVTSRMERRPDLNRLAAARRGRFHRNLMSGRLPNLYTWIH